MNMQELREHFGSQIAAARALGVSRKVVSSWNTIGIPWGRQCELQLLTGGKLRAERAQDVTPPPRRGRNGKGAGQ